ncbi:hypothetical protein ACWGH8_02915 [Nonomuraea muscovyensis]|uniref:Putative lipoprotein n=1 Tax=Nonomuraea muscovyensis TaxID=1124761 RepID=A0A7X0C924_9ACTN|nr:hypothetical protein [Nonomuraea muscovyensis]MBB6350833.1 putative lipoprotein [Nonomuraea muscovyensis]
MRKTMALAVAAVALAGCGMLPAQQGAGGEERQTQDSRPPTVQSETAPPVEPVASATQEQPAQGGEVIASRETKVTSGGQSGAARAEISALKRQGRTVTLTWTVTALSGSVNLHNGMSTATLEYSVDAVSLIDPVNAKRYRVARNGSGSDAECVCSDTQGQFLKKDETSTLYAVFAAPPPDVTKINVEMPMIGVITDVPIS